MANPDPFPRDGSVDASAALLRQGYEFIGRRCDRLGTDAFHTRLMLRDALCLRGPDAVDLVYGQHGLTRKGAMPFWVLRLLQDHGSVQQLEAWSHLRRKEMFVRLLVDEASAEAVAGKFADLWLQCATSRPPQFEVLRGTSHLLAAAAIAWCGLPESMARSEWVPTTLFRMSDRTGSLGPSTWTTLLKRSRLERRLRAEVRLMRRNGEPAGDTPLARLARARDAEGQLLSDAVVAVELLNLLRPIVAVGRYIAFAALALHEHPQWRDRIAAGDDDAILPFCEEVRRLAPFFPFTAAIATQDIAFRGGTIRAGQWIVVDLYGTCRDPKAFPDPRAFHPDRDWQTPAVQAAAVPQGGGDLRLGHRCPGERVTLVLMAEAVRLLCRRLDYDLPDQDLSVSRRRIPAQPASGVILKGLRPRD